MSSYKKTLNAAVSFQDLVINEAEKLITSGTIAIAQEFSFDVADTLDLNISNLGFSADGISLDCIMDIPSVGGMVALPALDFKGLKLGIALELNALAINWDNPGVEMIQFENISGKIDFGTLFAEVDGALQIDIPQVTIPGTDILLSTLKARVDVTGSMPTLIFDTADLSLPLYDDHP